VAIYLLSLAEMTGVDLQDEIEAKMAKNAARVYPISISTIRYNWCRGSLG
jgi:hypothetical protein